MKRALHILFILFSMNIAAQSGSRLTPNGKLSKAKTNLKQSNSNDSSGKTNRGNAASDVTGDDVETFFRILGYSLYGIFGNGEYSDLNIYPYYQHINGEYLTDAHAEDKKTGEIYAYHYKKSDLRMGTNYFSGSTVNGFQVQGSFRPIFILGIDASYKMLYESEINGPVDLNIFNVMGNLYRVRTKDVTGWWGLGYTRVGSDIDAGGFSYQFGIDYFPVYPVSLRALWKQSFVNKHAINLLQLQGKYHFKRAAVYLGWDYNKIAGITISGVAVGLEYVIH